RTQEKSDEQPEQPPSVPRHAGHRGLLLPIRLTSLPDEMIRLSSAQTATFTAQVAGCNESSRCADLTGEREIPGTSVAIVMSGATCRGAPDCWVNFVDRAGGSFRLKEFTTSRNQGERPLS